VDSVAEEKCEALSDQSICRESPIVCTLIEIA